MRLRYLLLFSIGVMLVVGGMAAFALTRPHRFGGSLIDPPVAAPKIELLEAGGGRFRLEDQSGMAVILFFGYTSCPDVCPATLADFRTIKTRLGTWADRVKFVFITVDPERDTPERVRSYLSNFDAEFIGLTGSRGELEPVWKAYGVYQEQIDSGSSAGYLVDHSSRIYAIDPRGNLRVTYLFGTDREAIANDILFLLEDQR
jgi:protein SCO1/2